MMNKIRKWLKKNWPWVLSLAASLTYAAIEKSKNKSLQEIISQKDGEILSCEKANRELLKETEHMSRIIGKQQMKINNL